MGIPGGFDFGPWSFRSFSKGPKWPRTEVDVIRPSGMDSFFILIFFGIQ